jgi:TonB-linked SusC/RagA family outer membrane protein
VTYHNESTVFPMSTGDQKGAAHWSLTSTTNDQKFKLVVTGNYMVDQKNLPGYDITTFLNTAPDAPPLYNPDGSLNWANSTWTNPLAYTKTSYNGTTNNLVANAILSYNIMKGLYLKSSFGYTYMETHESSLSPISSQDPAFSPTGSANFSDNNIHSWIVEPQASYLFLTGRSRFEALAGATFEDNSTNGQELSGTGYTSDVTLQSIYNAPEVRVATVTSDIYKYNALFGRLNYNYAEKYLLDLNWRRDGSSRFGPANQFHNFASVGAGWIFTKEDFFPKGVLSYGKLRGSYGTTGNDQIGDYRFYNLYAGAGYPYQGTTALIPTGLYNPNLAWELTKKAEVALELGFIHDRVLVSGSFYRDRSSNELLSSLLPSITGFNSIPENFPATVQNQGWEFSVNTINIDTKHFRWKTTFNFTMNKNKLIAFPNLSSNPNYANVYYVGKSITTSPVFHCLGVDPATGIYAFADSAGKETFNPSYVTDRVAFIDYAPKFYGGIGNSITFKGWQLDFFFQFRKQMGVNPLLSQFAAPGMFTNNMLKGVLSRWQNPGDKSSVEMFTQNFSSTAFTAYQYAQQSDLSVTDASYIRLSSVSLSYTLPGEWVRRWKGQGLQLFVRGQNLLTITKYPGMDPETQTISGLPVMRVITGGAQLSF